MSGLDQFPLWKEERRMKKIEKEVRMIINTARVVRDMGKVRLAQALLFMAELKAQQDL